MGKCDRSVVWISGCGDIPLAITLDIVVVFFLTMALAIINILSVALALF